jgi:hypothetical protein
MAWWRLAVLGVLAAAVTAALYAAGRLHQPDYAFSLFGADPFPAKSPLATIAPAMAAAQEVLALSMYRALRWAPRVPKLIRPVHRVSGVVLFALAVPVAVHCLIAYTVQPTSPRVTVHSVAGCFSMVPSPPRSSRCTAGGSPALLEVAKRADANRRCLGELLLG